MNKKREKLKKMLLLLFLIIIGGLYIFLNILYFRGPVINLEGKLEETININSIYKESGYKAKYICYDVTNQVQINNNINFEKIGDYEVVYQIKYKNKNYKKVRKIHVADIEAPIITLNENSYACPNKEFNETGFIVSDNYDQDLKNKVEVEKNKDKWIYKVKDKSGNETMVERKIIYEDKDAPIITLNSPIYNIYVNSTYVEPGFTVKDNCSESLKNKVKITGQVDTSKLGKYFITYEVMDESSNKTEVKRTVNVIKRPGFVNEVIYLTFDDGPSANITPQILDILKEENVKATFFVNDHGRHLDYLIKRAVNEGHTVASHTASHNFYYVYSSEETFFNEIDAVHNIIYNLTGKKNKIIRFPGGSSNTISRFNPGIMTKLVKAADARGYIFYDWTIDSNDAGGSNTKKAIYNNVVKYMGYRYLNIVLMHDSADKYATLAALRDIIKYGKNNGFSFLPITETTPQARHHVNN